MDKKRIYKKLIMIGRATGCHQLPEQGSSIMESNFQYVLDVQECLLEKFWELLYLKLLKFLI